MTRAKEDKAVGFIGLGNVGAKLAGSLLRNGADLTIRDLDEAVAAPLQIEIFKDGIEKYGPREFSPNIIRRLEEAHGLDVSAAGFPDEITDGEPEESGYEVIT
jgi:hypothetical protein